MEFSFSDFFSILSLLIATAALYLSYKTYRRDTPKIEIDISKPQYDCFFGAATTQVMTEQHKNKRYHIAGVYLTLRNNSASDIQISKIQLKVQGELFRMIDCGNPFWNEVAFWSFDADENCFTPDWGYSLDYNEKCISIPSIVKGYTAIDGYALFYDFPVKIKRKKSAILVVTTAVGKIKKRIKLYEYDNTFGREDYANVKQYFRSQGDM